MAKRKAVGIGIIGLGTVGSGVVEILQKNASVLEARLGFPLQLVRIATRTPARAKTLDLHGVQLDTDAAALVADPRVDIVVEVMGGDDVARTLIRKAFENGKHVVTANKALLALHGKEIFGAADKAGVDIAFEASVAGGIPILRALREGLAANRILSLYGIINGTTNYMLTEMQKKGEAFESVLARAQALGYAEADPSFDIDGIDAAQKLTLLVSMAFGAELTFKEIPTEGIRGLSPIDFDSAKELGYRIKFLGVGKLHRDEKGAETMDARVHPAMIPSESLLANIDGVMNAVAVTGDAVGTTLYSGAGAGSLPTASAVVSDVMELAREVMRGVHGRLAPLAYQPEALRAISIRPLSQWSGRCYLRFTARDQSGVLSKITGTLGEHGIGIETILQRGKGAAEAAVPIVVMTHPAREAEVRHALSIIDTQNYVTAPTKLVRVEEDL